MLRKSSILLSCNSLHSLHHPGSTSQTSLPPHTTRCGPCRQHRLYAMVSGGHSRHDHGRLRWPDITSADAIPTPYQIFNQKRGSPYSKRRFYELVKLYHPDRHDHESPDDRLSCATKLERYRLIIAANDILSNPVKRGAYDCYGAGWNGQPDVAGPRESAGPAAWGSYRGRGWGSDPKGPSQNATWEDWEKWYQRDTKGAQEPQYVSNSAFVSLIVIFAALGGIGQATRVGNYSMSFLEQRDALHDSISKDLIHRRMETTTAFGTREERIDSFLRQRDLMGYGVKDPKDTGYRKLLPAPQNCSGEDVKHRRGDIYQTKKENSGDG